MNLAVADSNRVRNVKEGGEGDDRSLSMAGLLSTKTQMKTGTLILSFLLLVLPNPVFFFFFYRIKITIIIILLKNYDIKILKNILFFTFLTFKIHTTFQIKIP